MTIPVVPGSSVDVLDMHSVRTASHAQALSTFRGSGLSPVYCIALSMASYFVLGARRAANQIVCPSARSQ
jgi:hypothetical protein